MIARSADTDPETERVHLDLLRRAGPDRRLQMSLDLSAVVITLAKQALQRSMPNATPTEVDLRFVELHYGRELAADLRRYLATHPR